MKIIAVVVGMLVLLSLATIAMGDKAAATEIEWAPSFEKALQIASQADRLVMVDVYTEWCGWCKELDKKVYTNAKVIEAVAKDFVAVKVDGDKRKDLVTKYKVRGYPTILFLDGKGELVHKVVGFEAPPVFLVELCEALTRRKMQIEAAELGKKVEAGQADGATLARLTYLNRRLGDLAAATKYMKGARQAGYQDPGLSLDCILLTKKGTDCVSALKSWLDDNPGHSREAEARFELAMAFAAARQWQEAYDTFNQVASSAPDTLWGAKASYFAGIVKDRFLKEEDCNT